MSARQQQQFSPAPCFGHRGTALPLYIASRSERRDGDRRQASALPPSLARPFVADCFLPLRLCPPVGRWFLRPRMVGAFARPPSPHPHPFPPPSLSLPCPLPPSRTSALYEYTEKRARRGTFLSIYFHLLFICPSLFLFSLSMPLRVLQRGIAVLKLSLASRALPALSDEKTEAVSESCEVTGTEQSPPL